MNTFKLTFGKELDEFFKNHFDWINNTITLEEGNFLNDKFDKIYNAIQKGGFNVITADTGMGKTAFAKQLFSKSEFERIIFIAPLEIIVKEVTADLGQPAEVIENLPQLVISSDVKDSGMVELSNGNKTVAVCTYHHFINNIEWVKDTDLLVIDEMHWLHTYTFAGELCGKLLTAIKYLREKKCTVLGLSATPELLLMAAPWLFIDKFIQIKTDNLRIPPKKIVLYPGYGNIPNTQLVKHYIENYVDFDTEKVLVVIDGGNTKNTTFHNFVASLKSLKNVEISAQKAPSKMTNADVQYIIEFKRLTDSTKMFIATIWISNGINIYDESIKHVIVLSDQPNIIKQTASRIRIPNAINLVIFQQYRPIETPISYEEIDKYLWKCCHGIANAELKYRKFENCKKWEYFGGQRMVWNPISTLQSWYEHTERAIFSNFEKLTFAMKTMYPNIPIEIVGEKYLNKQIGKKEIAQIRNLLHFEYVDTKQLSTKNILLHFGISEIEEEIAERKLYTKLQMEKLLKKKNLTWGDVESVYDKNRHKKYKLKE